MSIGDRLDELGRSQKKETYQEPRDEILGLLIETFGKGVVERLDLLPGEVFGEPVKGEPTGDHLVQYASKRPEIRT